MGSKARTFVGAALVLGAACGAPRTEDQAPLGTAAEAWCSGLYVDHLSAQAGSVLLVTPDQLATATEGWGPMSLSLTVDQGFSPQVSYQSSPSLQREQDKLTATLQTAVGFSLTTSTNLTASTTVLVPTDAYYRLEAYPEYQVLDFDVRSDACGPMPDELVSHGTVRRPVSIYFRVMVFVGGEWNALHPPDPASGAGGAAASSSASAGSGGAGGGP
jgi:hypothetical protein